jgi:hypothetical protein
MAQTLIQFGDIAQTNVAKVYAIQTSAVSEMEVRELLLKR